MKYLITGGAGFIGSHLAEKLIARGDQVVIFDNLSTGSANNLSGIKEKVKFEEGNILDKAVIDKLVSESDYVVHLAAALGVFNIVNKPLESLKTNLQGSEIVLEACDKYRKPVLIASTSEIYGKNDKNEVHIHFQNSLQNGLILQQTNLETFNDILHLQKDSKKYRPTLFDFISHNALEFYKTSETSITQASYKFEVDKNDFEISYIFPKTSKNSNYESLRVLTVERNATSKIYLKNM